MAEPPLADPFATGPAGGDAVFIRSRRPIQVKRSSDMGGLLAVFVLLLAAAGGLGYYFLWQQQQDALRQLRVEREKKEAALTEPAATDVAAVAPAATPVTSAARATNEAGTAAQADGSGALGELLGADESGPRGGAAGASGTERPARMERPERPSPKPPDAAPAEPPMRQTTTAPTADAPSRTTSQPPPRPPSEPAAIEKSLRSAYAAIRGGDFETAAKAIDSVEAGDDKAVGDRVARWQRFLGYSKGFKELRGKAYKAAANSEFELDDRIIIIVEIDDERIVYRDSGKQRRMRLDELPADIDRAIVEQWLGRDGRAANHLFLGASHLAKDRPSPADASREWRRAASGGEADGRLLEPLVNDPVVVDAE